MVLIGCQSHGCRRPSASMSRRPGACIGSLLGAMECICYSSDLWEVYGGDVYVVLEWVLVPSFREGCGDWTRMSEQLLSNIRSWFSSDSI